MTIFNATAQQSVPAQNSSPTTPTACPNKYIRAGRPKIADGEWGRISCREVETGIWAARARYRDFDGGVHDLKRFAQDPSDARDLLLQSMKRYGRKHYANLTVTPTMTVAELCRYFLSDLEREGVAKPQTLSGYKGVLRRHVLPALGSRVIKSLDIFDAEQFVQSLKQTGKAHAARSARQLLRRMFDETLRLGVLEKNPFDATKPVRRPQLAPRAATPEQLDALRAAANDWDSQTHSGPRRDMLASDVFTVLVGSGCRIGEALALRWDDVDLVSATPTIRICGTLSQDVPVKRQSFTKTEAGMRTLPIPSELADTLAARQARGLGKPNPENAVFPTSNGTWTSPGNFGRTWRRVREIAGRGLGEDLGWVTPHSMRRTVATRISETQGLEAAASQLGHSSSAVTARHYVERNTVARPDMTMVLQTMFSEMEKGN